MFTKFVHAIRKISSNGSFESYIFGLNKSQRSSGPTYDEARKDYVRTVKAGVWN